MSAVDSIIISDPLVALRRYAADLISGIAIKEFKILETANNIEAVELAEKHSPSFVIMEIASGDISGIQAAAQIWQANPGTRILFWTQYNRSIYLNELHQLVTDSTIYGVVLKDLPEDKLCYAISSIWLHDNPYLDTRIRQHMQSRKDGNNLTARELEVLQDMALGLTEKAIARRRNLTIRGVQSRTAAISNKLLPVENQIDELFSKRALVLCEAVRYGLIEPESLSMWKQDLDRWLQVEARTTHARR